MTAFYSRDEVSGPLSGAVGKEEAIVTQGKVITGRAGAKANPWMTPSEEHVSHFYCFWMPPKTNHFPHSSLHKVKADRGEI